MNSRFAFTVAAAVLAILSGVDAQAADWGQEVGGWSVGRTGDKCVMTMEFEGEGATQLTLLIADDADNTYLSVDNYRWSAKKDQEYELAFSLGEWVYTKKAIGLSSLSRPGFITMVNAEFLADFAKASGLRITMGEVLVDNLSLTGSAAGLAVLTRCRTQLARDLAEQRRERERLAHIPADPFASPDAASASMRARGATPDGQSRWMARIQENYPSRAIRDDVEGRVGVRAIVGANGRVTSCTVASSSGSAVLDEAACDGMIRYARFNPAIGDNGQPTTGTFSDTIVYQLNR